MSTGAQHPARGTTNTKHTHIGKDLASSPKRTTNNCARPGSDPMDASCTITRYTIAPDADRPPMEPTSALAHKIRFPTTLYQPDAWETALRTANLLHRFSHIPPGFRNGFIINFPHISHVQIPPNKDSVSLYRTEFAKTLDKEVNKNRYLGPFTASLLTALIGPFQSSPISIVPQPGRPGKFRLVQNFSYPLSPSPQFPNSSINSFVNANDFPTSWGTFSIVYLLISRLPPNSEAATRDVAEAYRTIPLHESQWPSAVVHADDDQFYLDTCLAFGATPSAGMYGAVADAGAEIIRHQGIGPLDKWVDDHIFVRIRRDFLPYYNTMRSQWHNQIVSSGNMRQSGGRISFPGLELRGGSYEEFNEDCSRPIKDLSNNSPRSPHDRLFTYNLQDIDDVSETLGIPWERSKDQPFNTSTVYIGFKWDLKNQTVSLASGKVDKYLRAIHEWNKRCTHVLKDVQLLYGKLLHAASVIPRGRAYLTGLERMLSLCSNRPFMPHRLVKTIANDLLWWIERLEGGDIQRPIKAPSPFIDHRAFSDASSGMGVGIVIGQRWRAWKLVPGWQTIRGANRDIGWAEAIGFELLVRALDAFVPQGGNLLVYGDNTGVVEGWWNGRHRNHEANNVFKRIHAFLAETSSDVNIRTEYIPSAENPADGPSRGVFPHRNLLLPRLPLPISLIPFLTDVVDLPDSQRRDAHLPVPSDDLSRRRRHNEAQQRAQIQHQIENDLIREALAQTPSGTEI